MFGSIYIRWPYPSICPSRKSGSISSSPICDLWPRTLTGAPSPTAVNADCTLCHICHNVGGDGDKLFISLFCPQQQVSFEGLRSRSGAERLQKLKSVRYRRDVHSHTGLLSSHFSSKLRLQQDRINHENRTNNISLARHLSDRRRGGDGRKGERRLEKS